MFMKIVNLTWNAYMFNEINIISFIPIAYSLNARINFIPDAHVQ